MDLTKLKEPFPNADVSWRVGQAGKNYKGEIYCKVLAYLTNRGIMDRLDEVCGEGNWRNEYQEWKVGDKCGVLCGISIRIGDDWVTKWDGAENTDIEPIKGGLSDSMKRAAVQWGIGRYLYDLGDTWADVQTEKPGGKDRDEWHYVNSKIKVDGKEEWVKYYWRTPMLPAHMVKGGTTPAQPTAEPAKPAPARKPPVDATKPVVSPTTVDDAFKSILLAKSKDQRDNTWAAAKAMFSEPDDQQSLNAAAVQWSIERFADIDKSQGFMDWMDKQQLSDNQRDMLNKMLTARLATLEPEGAAA